MGMLEASMTYKIKVALKVSQDDNSLYLTQEEQDGFIHSKDHKDKNSWFLFENVDNYTIRIKSSGGYIGR